MIRAVVKQLLSSVKKPTLVLVDAVNLAVALGYLDDLTGSRISDAIRAAVARNVPLSQTVNPDDLLTLVRRVEDDQKEGELNLTVCPHCGLVYEVE